MKQWIEFCVGKTDSRGRGMRRVRENMLRWRVDIDAASGDQVDVKNATRSSCQIHPTMRAEPPPAARKARTFHATIKIAKARSPCASPSLRLRKADSSRIRRSLDEPRSTPFWLRGE